MMTRPKFPSIKAFMPKMKANIAAQKLKLNVARFKINFDLLFINSPELGI